MLNSQNLDWKEEIKKPCLLRSSSATAMLRSPGEARGGQQQGGGPRSESLWPGWRKDALYRWESMGGSFLNARGRTASASKLLDQITSNIWRTMYCSVWFISINVKKRKENFRLRKYYASQVQLRSLRNGPVTSKLARTSPKIHFKCGHAMLCIHCDSKLHLVTRYKEKRRPPIKANDY
eukprot:1157410-Pelagomonas_calceolata.AAC.14